KQLNTWVSFQSAEQPLLGQFSVSGNTVDAILVCLVHLIYCPAISRSEPDMNFARALASLVQRQRTGAQDEETEQQARGRRADEAARRRGAR
ncbi:hypothetical protein LU676_05925, partial [Pseudomonas alloputida]|uniref:hypothetical protein n=1 Tax=Pseudomonas alloputida TaxID=1940621 RepID=UPI001E5B60F1